MKDTLITISIYLSGCVSAVFLLGAIGYYVKKFVKHVKVSKPDRDLKKLKKLQARCKKD